MRLTGNKGEWSELYAFFKLLADGCLYCGDGQSNRYDDRVYPILKIFRDDRVFRNTYSIRPEEQTIIITGEDFEIKIPQQRFREEAELLLKNIKSIKGNAAFPYLESFMTTIRTNSVKAKSDDKADIRIVIHNLNTGSKPELGYSIKSELGANPTLINANADRTNFIYEIRGINPGQATDCNNLKKFKDKLRYLQSLNATVKFQRTSNQVLHNNLMMLDIGLAHIIGEELLYYYSGNERSIMKITELVANKDPLHIAQHTDQPMYAYKIKQFLLAFALGMTPSTPWHGIFHANGGYIVVKKDGDIVCYHFFDRNDLEEYLFNNTCFETPGTTRHKFGDIYEESDKFFIKLNLQVRFK